MLGCFSANLCYANPTIATCGLWIGYQCSFAIFCYGIVSAHEAGFRGASAGDAVVEVDIIVLSRPQFQKPDFTKPE